MAAKAHATPTGSINRKAAFPIDWKETCASGFRRQSESKAVPGKRSSPIVRVHIVAPNTKKAAKALSIGSNFKLTHYLSVL
jgi:hypothetical protein